MFWCSAFFWEGGLLVLSSQQALFIATNCVPSFDFSQSIASSHCFCRAFRKFSEMTKFNDQIADTAKRSMILETLSLKVGNDLAEEVKSSWIDPTRVVIKNYLGQGKNLFSIIFSLFKIIFAMMRLTSTSLVPGNFACVWSALLEVEFSVLIPVAVKKPNGKSEMVKDNMHDIQKQIIKGKFGFLLFFLFCFQLRLIWTMLCWQISFLKLLSWESLTIPMLWNLLVSLCMMIDPVSFCLWC